MYIYIYIFKKLKHVKLQNHLIDKMCLNQNPKLHFTILNSFFMLDVSKMVCLKISFCVKT